MPRDDVDELIATWTELLPGVDLTPLDVMSRIRRAFLELQRMRRASFRAAGLTTWEFDVLSVLRRAGDGAERTAGQLARASSIGTPAMTNRLRRLVERGLVERRTDPADSRAVLIRLTADGATHVDDAMRRLVRLERHALAVLTAEERAVLARSLRALTR